MSGTAALCGMISSISITMLYVFQHKGIIFILDTSFLGNMEANWFFGISPNAFGAVGAIVNFSVAFMVGKYTGPAPKHIQQLVENFRPPQTEEALNTHH